MTCGKQKPGLSTEEANEIQRELQELSNRILTISVTVLNAFSKTRIARFRRAIDKTRQRLLDARWILEDLTLPLDAPPCVAACHLPDLADTTPASQRGNRTTNQQPSYVKPVSSGDINPLEAMESIG